MSQVWDEANASGGELLVLLALADFSNEKIGCAWPSIETLSKKSRLSIRQTQYVIRSLERKGLLEVKPNEGPRGTNLYIVTVKGAADCRGAETAGVQSAASGGAAHCTQTVNEPLVQVRTKSRGSIEEIRKFCIDESLTESDGDWFFHKCEGNGWTNKGSPIRDWKATIRSWRAAGYMPSQRQRTKSFSPGKESASDMVQRMLKGINERTPTDH